MALAFQSGESIKQALFEELQNILSPIKDVRMGAESRMKHLEFTEGKCDSIQSKLQQMVIMKFIRLFGLQVMASIWPNS